MRDFRNDVIKAIKPSGIRKLFDVASEMPQAISLGVGEPDFETPWSIREEAILSLQKGRTFYTSNAGMKELRSEISKYVKRKYDLDYDPEDEICITVGGSEAIDMTLRAVLNPGDEVVYPEPCYVSYEPCIRLAGGVAVPMPLTAETEFRLTPEVLEAAITPKTKVLLISYPNNPTGAIMEREDLEPIAKIAKKYDLLVVSDEIYSELSYGKPHVSIGSLPDMKERTVVINGFSKAFAMTGWRLGYFMAQKELANAILKIHQFAIMCAPTASQYAGIEAMKNCDDEIKKMRAAYDERRRYLMGALKEMGIPCFEPLGAFYIFPDISQFGMNSEEFCAKFLREEEVAVVPGSAFGDCGAKHVRISYAYSLDELKEAMTRLKRFVEKLRKK